MMILWFIEINKNNDTNTKGDNRAKIVKMGSRRIICCPAYLKNEYVKIIDLKACHKLLEKLATLKISLLDSIADIEKLVDAIYNAIRKDTLATEHQFRALGFEPDHEFKAYHLLDQKDKMGNRRFRMNP